MRCKTIAQLLSEYVDGALPAGQVAELEQHLADCEQCRQALDDLRQTLALVQELEEVATPEDLLDRRGGTGERQSGPEALAVPAELPAVARCLGSIVGGDARYLCATPEWPRSADGGPTRHAGRVTNHRFPSR